jgi:hypothetical protein
MSTSRAASRPSPCQRCQGPCCLDPKVELNGHDLWRLCRALGADWEELVTVEESPNGFRLDGGHRRWGFRLRRNAAGACLLSIDTPGHYHRCGVYGLEPSSCRVYPYHVQLLDGPLYQVALGANARCPAPQALVYRARIDEAVAMLDEQIGEQALYARLVARWDAGVERAAFEPAQFVLWTSALYDAVEPLRARERGLWQLAAYERVDGFPLPSEEE